MPLHLCRWSTVLQLIEVDQRLQSFKYKVIILSGQYRLSLHTAVTIRVWEAAGSATFYMISQSTRSDKRFSSSSSIGTTAHCGLWPVEQCPSIFSYLPPTLSSFSLPTLEDLFLLPLSIFCWVFPFFSSLLVLEWRSFWASFPPPFSLSDLTSLSDKRFWSDKIMSLYNDPIIHDACCLQKISLPYIVVQYCTNAQAGSSRKVSSFYSGSASESRLGQILFCKN